jgi:dihydrofolate reductase
VCAVRVFIACSLDGFIAGPDGDLSWLPTPGGGGDYGYAEFMAGTDALLVGRATYETVAGFGGAWPYGTRPVFVATTRALAPAEPTVRAVRGTPRAMLAEVRRTCQGGVYLDGGTLIRQFLAAELVDELTVSVVPTILGAGVPLFAGASRRHALDLVGTRAYDDGLVQLTYSPARPSA